MSYPNVQCFLLEVTDQVDRKLRRYAAIDPKRPDIPPCPLMPGQYGRHEGLVDLDVVTEDKDNSSSRSDGWPHDDPRWPKQCGCGYVFKDNDNWQLFCEHLWRRKDSGELMTLRNAPPGAMWFASWFEHVPEWCGPDGKALVVRCPDGHDWRVHSRCSNCTMPNDKVHKCWIRHGEAPAITVDKDGVTCQAGGGSILTPKWHGFLRNGVLTAG